MSQRKGGIIQAQREGQLLEAKGEWEYNLGATKKTAIVGAAKVDGYKEEVQVPFIQGKLTDNASTDVKAMMEATDETLTLILANGKVVVLRNAWFAAEGNITTGEGEIDARWEGLSAQEIQ